MYQEVYGLPLKEQEMAVQNQSVTPQSKVDNRPKSALETPKIRIQKNTQPNYSKEVRTNTKLKILEKNQNTKSSELLTKRLHTKNNWPMLVMNNDFASQLQEKVAKNYIERTYDNLYRKQVSIEEKVSKATSRIDTGLKKSDSARQLTKRPKTALTMRRFKR